VWLLNVSNTASHVVVFVVVVVVAAAAVVAQTARMDTVFSVFSHNVIATATASVLHETNTVTSVRCTVVSESVIIRQ
jgi:hypothetical protein